MTTDHFAAAEAALADGDTARAQVHATLAVAQRLDERAADPDAGPEADLADAVRIVAHAGGTDDELDDDAPRRPARFDVVVGANEDVAAAVASAKPSQTVLLPAGVLRSTWGLRPATGVQLWSEGVTNLRGTTLLPTATWRSAGSGRWRAPFSARLLPDYATVDNVREPGDPSVQPERLYADGEPLRRVTMDPGPGEWSLQVGAQGGQFVVTGESPHEAVFELAHGGPDDAYDAISSEADDVTVVGIHVSHYAVPLFRGAIGRHHDDLDAMGERWRLHRVAVSEVHGVGLALGAGAVVTRCDVRGCRQVGVRAVRAPDETRRRDAVVLRDAAVADCGVLGHPEVEAGGVSVRGLAVRGERLWLHDNHGVGWVVSDDRTDGASSLRASLVERNGHAGVADVRSSGDGAVARELVDNVVRDNGATALSGTDDGAGVAIVDSADVRLTGNVLLDNGGPQLLVAAADGAPGLADLRLRNNRLAGRRPLAHLRRGRGAAASPRAALTGHGNQWHAAPGDKVLVLPDGRTADLTGWPLTDDELADPDVDPRLPAARDLQDLDVGPRD